MIERQKVKKTNKKREQTQKCVIVCGMRLSAKTQQLTISAKKKNLRQLSISTATERKYQTNQKKKTKTTNKMAPVFDEGGRK